MNRGGDTVQDSWVERARPKGGPRRALSCQESGLCDSCPEKPRSLSLDLTVSPWTTVPPPFIQLTVDLRVDPSSTSFPTFGGATLVHWEGQRVAKDVVDDGPGLPQRLGSTAATTIKRNAAVDPVFKGETRESKRPN